MTWRLGVAAAMACIAPQTVAAHAIGQRYDLPLPVQLYIAGGAATVALSFVIAALAIRAPHDRMMRGATGHMAPRAALAMGAVLQLLGIVIFALILLAGLFGQPHPARNIAPTLVWIMWWIGLALFTAFVTNLWPWLNPWRSLAVAASRVRGRTAPAPPMRYPPRLAQWPAVALLLGFAWFELVYPDAADPLSIALAAIGYSVLVVVGMAAFGRETWLQHGEAFTVLFAALGRFAPVSIESDRVQIRCWGGGLLGDAILSKSMVAFIAALLATVLFDGFLGTAGWRSFERGVRSLLPLGFDRDGLIAATLALLLLWAALLAAYVATASVMARWSGAGSAWDLAGLFAPTLIPIAIGYNVAHNLSYLMAQGLRFPGLASDPLGRGWDLFGTASLGFEEVAGLEPATLWTIALVAIVGGHLISVYVAHHVGLKNLAGRRKALRALVPLTVLMVGYTVLSLTVIAEPLVRFRKPDPDYTCLELICPDRLGLPQMARGRTFVTE